MNKTLLDILHYIQKAIKDHPIKESGKQYDPKVHYMNGNDSTDFDWNVNDRTCEFFVFYNSESGLGYIKVYATRKGQITGYVWDTERYQNGEQLEPMEIGESRAKSFKGWLNTNFDKQHIWDSVVADLNDIPPFVPKVPKPKYYINYVGYDKDNNELFSQDIETSNPYRENEWSVFAIGKTKIFTSKSKAQSIFKKAVNEIREELKIDPKKVHFEVLHKEHKTDTWFIRLFDTNGNVIATETA